MLLSFDDALRRALEAATPIERIETVGVGDADGRVVARDVTAAADVPPFSRSAMDGYAVRAADVANATDAGPVTLTCIGVVFTGRMSARIDLRTPEAGFPCQRLTSPVASRAR